jgi:hypothetical protein
MVKDSFKNMKMKGGERFKLSYLYLRLVGKMFRWARFLIPNE